MFMEVALVNHVSCNKHYYYYYYHYCCCCCCCTTSLCCILLVRHIDKMLAVAAYAVISDVMYT